jgi:predicted nucleic acid-binding protein
VKSSVSEFFHTFIVLGHRRLSARDAAHLAVMEQHGINRILSFDSGFDGFPSIARLS